MQAATLASNLSSRLEFPVESALVFSNPEPARLTAALQEQISQTSSLVSLWHANVLLCIHFPIQPFHQG